MASCHEIGADTIRLILEAIAVVGHVNKRASLLGGTPVRHHYEGAFLLLVDECFALGTATGSPRVGKIGYAMVQHMHRGGWHRGVPRSYFSAPFHAHVSAHSPLREMRYCTAL